MESVIGVLFLGLIALGAVIRFIEWFRRVFNVGRGARLRAAIQTPYGAACIMVSLHKEQFTNGNMHLREMMFAYKQAFDILCGYKPDETATPSDCIGQAMIRRFVHDFVRPMEGQWQSQQISDADLYVFYEGAFPRVAPFAKGGPQEPSSQIRKGQGQRHL